MEGVLQAFVLTQGQKRQLVFELFDVVQVLHSVSHRLSIIVRLISLFYFLPSDFVLVSYRGTFVFSWGVISICYLNLVFITFNFDLNFPIELRGDTLIGFPVVLAPLLWFLLQATAYLFIIIVILGKHVLVAYL